MHQCIAIYLFSLPLLLCFCTLSLQLDTMTRMNDKSNSCSNQQKMLQTSNIKSDTFIHEKVFINKTHQSIILTWAGDNSATLILASVPNSAIQMLLPTLAVASSQLFRSTDDGKTYTDITSKVDSAGSLSIRKSNGLQRNAVDTNIIYLVCNDPSNPKGTLLWISLNRGESWTMHKLSFLLTGAITFHHSKKNLLLTSDSTTKALWGSQDSGKTWKLLHANVIKFELASHAEADETIFVTHDPSPQNNFGSILAKLFHSQSSETERKTNRVLLKSTDFGENWKQLADSIYSFSFKGNFLFISRADENSISRHLKVSTDYGASFHHVQLPAVTPDRFFSILDMSEGLVFIHVDDPGNNGFGTIYTSDAKGEIFSKSLDRHFYSEATSITDFYKVESMSGTFMTTVMNADNSMHSVITFDRGAIWHKIRKPENDICSKADTDKGKPCHLQVAHKYSMVRRIPTLPPVSISNAVGLIIAHGHTAPSLQASNTNVYISSDGGYNWIKSLDGPHHIQIADHGGLLVAVPYESNPHIIKFSTDEGNCWHNYTITNSTEFIFTGLLTEPGNKAMTAAVWGFCNTDKNWITYILDFSKVVTKNCTASDYQPWLSNGEHNSDKGENFRGCVMGSRVEYKKLKKDSWCRNGYAYAPDYKKTSKPCECTERDYECEYGYTRPIDSLDCTRDESIATLDICIDGNAKELVMSKGFRKLPGNNCTGGFAPNKTLQKMLNQKCSEHAHDNADKKLDDDRKEYVQKIITSKDKSDTEYMRKVVSIFVPLCITFIIVLSLILAIVIAAKLRSRRRRQLAYHYSTVSSRGRSEDLPNGNVQFKPHDDLLNPDIPRPVYSSSSRGFQFQKKAGTDKELLISNEPDDNDVELLQ